jgi:hypothetical protein
MACDHVGGPELIEMAEEHLRKSGIPAPSWVGSKFRYTENLTDGPWASVVVEIERQGNGWIVTRLDRRALAAPEADTGFRVLQEAHR